MQASNQGFVDLHTPFGMMLIGVSFLILTVILAVGGFYFKYLMEKDSLQRAEMRERVLAARAAGQTVNDPPL